MLRRLLSVLGALALLTGLAAAPASAGHAWGNYHWARTANPFTVPLGDNVTNTAYSNWDGALREASADWTRSSVLDSPIVAGGAGNPTRCAGTDGKIEVCNAAYGPNGWLGLATIWTSGSHIVRATTKVNDTYYNGNQATYDYDAERHVMCQEVGHGYGLGHQDESGADFNTCMDYSNALDNPHPNAHDYEQLEIIYSHVDSTSTVRFAPANAAPIAVERTDRIHSSTIVEDYGNGYRIHRHITWALDGHGHGHGHDHDE
ncbi:MAG: hypothetical protein M3321_04590 [Actinomycetota bacterium]|nr:hypothetical protein [Actinomycetota bacterium]